MTDVMESIDLRRCMQCLKTFSVPTSSQQRTCSQKCWQDALDERRSVDRDNENLVAAKSKCQECGMPLDKSGRRGALRYCSVLCRERANAKHAVPPKKRPASRRPLPTFATEVGWSLRKDIERIERILADDRFPLYKHQVAATLSSHLAYLAEVLPDLISRIEKEGT